MRNKQNYGKQKTHHDTKNKKIREYSKPNLYECRGNKKAT